MNLFVIVYVCMAEAVLYQPAENFTCFDGLATIDFQHINDDYCDCADGSDEPGKSEEFLATLVTCNKACCISNKYFISAGYLE